MKTSVLLTVALAALFLSLSGCRTPGYTSQERYQMIGRNWGWEFEQTGDDVDHMLLLRPRFHLSRWDMR